MSTGRMPRYWLYLKSGQTSIYKDNLIGCGGTKSCLTAFFDEMASRVFCGHSCNAAKKSNGSYQPIVSWPTRQKKSNGSYQPIVPWPTR